MSYAIIENDKLYLPRIIYRSMGVRCKKSSEPIVTDYGYLYVLNHRSNVIALWLKYGTKPITLLPNVGHRAILVTNQGDVVEITLIQMWGELVTQITPIASNRFVTSIESHTIEMLQYGLDKGFSVDKCIKALSKTGGMLGTIETDNYITLSLTDIKKEVKKLNMSKSLKDLHNWNK